MAATEYLAFSLDDSDTGRVTISAPTGYDPSKFEVPTYTAKKGGVDVPGKKWVKIVVPLSIRSYYIELSELTIRVGGDAKTYAADWDANAKGTLACPMWDDLGRVLGTKDAGGLPSALNKPRVRTSPELLLKKQTDIWVSVARELPSANRSGRLWKCRDTLDPPLELFLVPDKAFLTTTQLQNCVDTIKTKDLDKWLKFTVKDPSEIRRVANIRVLSYNILGIFTSYMIEADIKRMIGLQTAGKIIAKDWQRSFITQKQAEDFHAEMITKADRTRFTNILNQDTFTNLTGKKPGDPRVDAGKIMGASANQWAAKFWPGDTAAGTAAEWLHRSSYSFGPIKAKNFQSNDNIIFGTYESNGHMTRAESVIDYAMSSMIDIFDTDASGTLNTRILNKGTYYVLNANGVMEPITIPDWVSDATHSYGWLSPELTYYGAFSAQHPTFKTPLDYSFTAKFHTFSTYLPLSVEGQVDRRAWAEYFTQKYGFLRTLKTSPPSSPSGRVALNAVTSDVPVEPSSPLPPTTLHSYIDIPLHRDAWLSVHNRDPLVVLQGTEVRNPRALRKPQTGRQSRDSVPDPDPEASTAEPPEGGFTLVGEIDLFGIKALTATLSSWHGPPPPDLQIGDVVPICQQVEIANLPLVSILPWVAGTPLEKAHLSEVTLTYQNYAFEPSKGVGMTISANLVVDEQFGSLNQLLSNVLQIPPDSLTLQVSASFGFNDSWSSLPSLSNFVLQGRIFVKDPTTKEYMSIKLCDGISLSNIGVRLVGLATPVIGGTVGQMTTSYGFGLFGELGLQIPSSQNLLDFNFDIYEYGGVIQLGAILKGEVWENALGLGLDLTTVTLSASFDASSPLSTLTLSVGAFLDADMASVSLAGSYSVGGNFTFTAEIEEFGLEGVLSLYRKFAGEEVDPPTDEELVIGSASITMSNTNGLTVTVNNVKYGDYTAANGALHIASSGVSLRAELQNIDFPEYGFKLVDVVLSASFQKSGAGKSSSVELDVVVQLDNVQNLPKIAGTVHIYKEPQDTKLQWTVYGAFDGLGSSTRFGKLIPELNGTFLGDIGLDDLALVVASKDEPALSTMNPLKYPIKQGVQICAVFAKIDQVEQLLRHPAPGLILAAGWSKDAGFMLDIALPSAGMIHLGRGITTDPIELQVNLKPIRLMISAGVKVPVPESTTPLDFKIALSVEGEEVYVSGQMIGLWHNPFGLSPQVTIGPNLALEVGINLPQFFATGTPSALGFAGGLSIGEVRGDVAVVINDDPTQELISGSLQNLSIQDVVSFTSDILNVNLPAPPDFIDFEKVALYISTGVMIGTTTYPKGFSFDADIKVFGTEVKASAKVTQNALVASASISALHIGPLSVTGAKGKDAAFDLQVGSSKQHILVDGAINMLGFEESLYLNLELLPKPEYTLNFALHLTPMLTFAVNSQMKGAANLNDLSRLEFHIHALMEQDILDYFIGQVTQTLESARNKADEDIEEAEEKVEQAKAAWKKAIDDAQQKLDEEYGRWKAREKEVYDQSTKVIDDYNARMHELEGDVDDAKKALDQAVREAEAKIRAANADRAAKMQAAEADVTRAKNDWDNDILEKERALDKAKQDLSRAFANAERDIDNAKRKVDGIQNEINSTKKKIYDYERAHWYEFWKKAAIPELYVGLGCLEAAKAIADGVLEACKAVLEGTDFLASKAAVTVAQEALDAVKSMGDGLLNAAKETLEGVDQLTQALVDAAEQLLEDVRIAGEEALSVAKKALDDFIKASTALLKAARDAIDALVQSVEWLAYQAASEALDLAKHGSAVLDVALGALELAKAAEDGIFDILDDFFKALADMFNITKIEVTADLAAFSRTFSLDAVVQGVIFGTAFELELALDLNDKSSFIHAIYSHVVKKAPRKPPPSTPIPYTPPNGIQFCLVHETSKKAIYSSTTQNPQVGLSPLGSDDQWFTLVPGTGDHQGECGIQSKKTSYMLLTRDSQEPLVWHLPVPVPSIFNWFKFERGQGQYENCFRLITPHNNRVLVSDSNYQSLSIAPATQFTTDQYFSFMWEEFEVVRIDYNLASGRILSSKVAAIATETHSEKSAYSRTIVFSLSLGSQCAVTLKYSDGFPLSTGYLVKGSPLTVTGTTITVDTSINQDWAFSETNTYTRTDKVFSPVTIEPNKSARIQYTLTSGELEVPCVVVLRSKKTGATAQTAGMWRGESTWGGRVTVEQYV